MQGGVAVEVDDVQCRSVFEEFVDNVRESALGGHHQGGLLVFSTQTIDVGGRKSRAQGSEIAGRCCRIQWRVGLILPLLEISRYNIPVEIKSWCFFDPLGAVHFSQDRCKPCIANFVGLRCLHQIRVLRGVGSSFCGVDLGLRQISQNHAGP